MLVVGLHRASPSASRDKRIYNLYSIFIYSTLLITTIKFFINYAKYKKTLSSQCRGRIIRGPTLFTVNRFSYSNSIINAQECTSVNSIQDFSQLIKIPLFELFSTYSSPSLQIFLLYFFNFVYYYIKENNILQILKTYVIYSNNI